MRRLAACAALVVALVTAACSGGTTFEPSGSPSGPPGTGAVTLQELDFHFDPVHLKISTDQGLTIQNQGAVLHNFTVKDTSVDIDVRPGETNDTGAIGGLLKPGDYPFYCKYHRNQGMIGLLTVEAAS